MRVHNFSPKMSRWGDEKTLKFVILYRNNECLWNPHIPQYKNNIARNNAYQDLLTNMDDSTLTVKIIKSKIKNLRSVYHSELKKIENSKRSGSGAATVYNPSMSWFHEMHSFLGDTGDYRDPISMELIQDRDEPSQDSQPSDAVSYSNSLTPQSMNVLSPSPSPTTEDRSQSRSSNNSSTRRRKRSLQEEPITYALDRLQNISSAINAPPNYDEFHYFAQNVAAQLRTLPLYDALDVQHEIQTILTAARRRRQYPNLSPFTQTMTFIPPSTNTNTVTYTPPTTNTQTMTFIPPSTNTNTVTYTPPTTNTQTMTFIPPSTNTNTVTYTPPTTNTQTMTFIPPSTNTNTVTYTLPYALSQSDSTVSEEDLLNKAWKMC
ncbi:uncharacterized protein LOC106129784 [Amyelois transitella]|uniref:uncharacterized protein LOC106129784 n=1 Tax=Amyelois transitella TaxID=680683 RepID=UPI00298FD70E|nr:uncharacterized protein LOC106129784 [Amyelois transitella]